MRLRVLLALCLFSPSTIRAFQKPAGGAPTGSSVHGRVIESKSGAPVKKSVVILRRAQEPGIGASTDAFGEFRFDNLEPGPYPLNAERAGFILDPAAERAVVNVKPAPEEAEVTLKLIRTGAISGRVLDSDGEPVTGASVQVVPLNQKKGIGPIYSATTNDRGEYRSFNLPPGHYRIAVSYMPQFQQMRVKMQKSRTSPPGAPDETYAVTYYPATLDPKLAATVNVGDGADLQGYDIPVRHARGVTVRGTVVASSGAPASAIVNVTLSPVRQSIGFRNHDQLIQDASGAFELANVLPGTYALTAIAPLADSRLSAHRIVEVGDADVDGIQLTLAPPQTIKGVVVPPDGRKMPAGLIAVLVSRETRYDGSGGIGQPGNDGVFQLRDVAPGDYDVALGNAGPADDLYVDAIRVGDDDALAGGIHIGGTTLGLLKIVLKANGGTVQAGAKDSNGKPMPDSYVKLVPDAPRRTQMALYADCKTDASGTCSMLGVAPGAYHAFAFAAERQLDFRDPAAASEVEDSGKPVTIAEGEHQSVDLTSVPEDK